MYVMCAPYIERSTPYSERKSTMRIDVCVLQRLGRRKSLQGESLHQAGMILLAGLSLTAARVCSDDAENLRHAFNCRPIWGSSLMIRIACRMLDTWYRLNGMLSQVSCRRRPRPPSFQILQKSGTVTHWPRGVGNSLVHRGLFWGEPGRGGKEVDKEVDW